MSMSKYVYIAFDFRGRVEIVRLMFAAAGVQYEDRRIPEFTERDWNKLLKTNPAEWKHSEEWLAIKPDTPFKQLPVLEVDGVSIAQSKTIQAFLGKRLGLVGKTELDEARTSMICEATNDAFPSPVEKLFMEKDAEKKANGMKKFTEETIPRYMSIFEGMAGDKGYFVADQLTYADIAFYQNLTWLSLLKVTADLDKYPKLKAIYENVEKNPGIAKWIKERPDALF